MSLTDWLTIHKTFIVDTLSFWWCQVKYNASSRTEADREKMEYVLLRETHTIEKGLSLREPRRGFGQQKVKDLLRHLTDYQQRYGQQHPDFLRYPLAAIRSWIDYTQAQGVEIDALIGAFEALANQSGITEVNGQAGVREVSRQEIQTAAAGNLASVLQSRHSVRYFCLKR